MEPGSTKESLKCAYSNNFSPNEWEGGLCQDSPPAQKLAFCPFDAIELGKWSRFLPITESESIMIWPTCKIDQSKKDGDRIAINITCRQGQWQFLEWWDQWWWWPWWSCGFSVNKSWVISGPNEYQYLRKNELRLSVNPCVGAVISLERNFAWDVIAHRLPLG